MKFTLAIIATTALVISTNANEDVQELISQEENLEHELIQHEQDIIAALDSLNMNRVVVEPATTAVDMVAAAATDTTNTADAEAVEGGDITINFDDAEEDEVVLDYDKEEGLVQMNDVLTVEETGTMITTTSLEEASQPVAVLYDAGAPEPVLYDASEQAAMTSVETTPTKLSKHQIHHKEKKDAKAAKDHKEHELSMPATTPNMKGEGNSKSAKSVGGDPKAKSANGEPKATPPPPKSEEKEEMMPKASKAAKTHNAKGSKRGKVLDHELSMPTEQQSAGHSKTHKQNAERMSMDYDAKAVKEGGSANAANTADTKSVVEEDTIMTETATTVIAAMVVSATIPMEAINATPPAVLEFTESPDADEAVSTIPDNASRTPDAIPQGTDTSGLNAEKFSQEVKDVLIGGVSGSSEGSGHHNSKESVGRLSVKDKERAHNDVVSAEMTSAASSSMMVGGFCLMASSAVAYAMMV